MTTIVSSTVRPAWRGDPSHPSTLGSAGQLTPSPGVSMGQIISLPGACRSAHVSAQVSAGQLTSPPGFLQVSSPLHLGFFRSAHLSTWVYAGQIISLPTVLQDSSPPTRGYRFAHLSTQGSAGQPIPQPGILQSQLNPPAWVFRVCLNQLNPQRRVCMSAHVRPSTWDSAGPLNPPA
jgi:hypothetical protein